MKHKAELFTVEGRGVYHDFNGYQIINPRRSNTRGHHERYCVAETPEGTCLNIVEYSNERGDVYCASDAVEAARVGVIVTRL